MNIQSLLNTDFDNLTWDVFESVSDYPNKAHRRMETLRDGSARPEGKDAKAVLEMYREKLEAAIQAIDTALDNQG